MGWHARGETHRSCNSKSDNCSRAHSKHGLSVILVLEQFWVLEGSVSFEARVSLDLCYAFTHAVGRFTSHDGKLRAPNDSIEIETRAFHGESSMLEAELCLFVL